MKTNYIELDTGMIERQLINLTQLTFEVTDACNLKCKYCAYGELYNDYDKRGNVKLSIKKAKLLLDYLKELWISHKNTSYKQSIYISFYGGEPLLNFAFIKKIVSYVENINIKNINFRFSMTSNALLLNKHMHYLVEKKFNLLISLDGNYHNHGYRVMLSGENSFEKVFSNVKLMQKTYPEYFNEKVNFNAVLHNRNSVYEITHFIRSQFGKIPNISELSDAGIRKDKLQYFWEIYKNKYESLHDSVDYEEIQKDMFIGAPEVSRLGIYLHQYSGNVFRSYNDLFIDDNKKPILPTGTCIPFSRKIFVTVNGKILPCERIGHQFALGSISEDHVDLDLERIAEKYNNWYKKFKSQCTKCYKYRSCSVCMFSYDDLNEMPICKDFLDHNGFDKYCKSNMTFLNNHPELYQQIMEKVLIK